MTYFATPTGVTLTVSCHDVAGDHPHFVPAREVLEMAAAVRAQVWDNPPPEED